MRSFALGLAASILLGSAAGQDCSPSWQAPLNASFNGPIYQFSLLDLDNTGRLTPVLCGKPLGGPADSAISVIAFRRGAWAPLDQTVVGGAYAAMMYDFDGPGPEAPQLVLAGTMRVEWGSPFTGLGQLTPEGWRTMAPNGSPDILCMKVLDPDGDAPLPPSIYVGTSRAGIERWNGVELERLSVNVLGTHTVVDLDAVDLDGPGPQPTRIIGLVGGRFVYSDGDSWAFSPPVPGQGYGFSTFDADGAGPQPPVILLPSSSGGLFAYGSDMTPRSLHTPETAVYNAAAIDTAEWPAAVYAALDGSQRTITRISHDLTSWAPFGGPGEFGGVSGFRPLWLETIRVCSAGRQALAMINGLGGAQGGRLFLYGCPFNGGCPADFNGDGFIDCFDYADFVAAFETGDPAADLAADGFVDFFDYDAFVASFEEGCL